MGRSQTLGGTCLHVRKGFFFESMMILLQFVRFPLISLGKLKSWAHREQISSCDFFPLQSGISFLCFDEYGASVTNSSEGGAGKAERQRKLCRINCFKVLKRCSATKLRMTKLCERASMKGLCERVVRESVV